VSFALLWLPARIGAALLRRFTKIEDDAMWSTVKQSAAAQPTPMVALAVAGMNGVLDTQGNTQATWWNRIPYAAWALMIADIDSPRGGVIRVKPLDLHALAESMRPH
jgi:hypothetical protein